MNAMTKAVLLASLVGVLGAAVPAVWAAAGGSPPGARLPRGARPSATERRFRQESRRYLNYRSRFDRRLGRLGDDGSTDNLPPPSERLLPETVSRTPLDPSARASLRESIRDLDVEALALVEALIAANRERADYGALRLKSDIDLWGGYHGEFLQTFRGVPFTKGSIVVHLPPEGGEPTFEDHFIDGFPGDLRTTPGMTESAAAAAALGWADPTGAHGHQTTVALKLHPLLSLELIEPTRGDSFENSRWVLQDVRLVWEVFAKPPGFDVEQEFELALSNAPLIHDQRGDEADRDASTFLGGRTEPEPTGSVQQTPGADVPWRFLIDAVSGEIIEAEPQVFDDLNQVLYPPTTGYGFGYFHTFVDLNTTYWPPFGSYVLADTFRPKPGSANIVYHGRNLSVHDSSQYSLFLDANNRWGNGSVNFADPVCQDCTHAETPAVDVAYGMQQTYDFFKNVVGRWGTDDKGKRQHAVVHWGVEYIDARYNGGSGLIEFGNGTQAGKPGNYGLGTVAHEIGHSFWHEEENGTSGDPAKALNEGHGDVLGGFVSIYESTTKGKGTWLYRLPWSSGNWRSRVRDPAGYEECVGEGDDESCVNGFPYWLPILELSPYEHVAGLPYARAVMFLADGSSDNPGSSLHTAHFPDTPLRGIGLNKAATLWHYATSYVVPSNPSYAQMWFSYLIAAELLYGANSMEKQAVFNAWHAIGIGPPGKDSASPSIPYAKVYDINPVSLTARTMAIVRDDAGAELVQPDTHQVRRDNSYYGMLDLAGKTSGIHLTVFRAEDSGGRAATAVRGYPLPVSVQLLTNTGFENSPGSSDWVNAVIENDRARALFGEHYANPGTAPMTQEVDLTGLVNPRLSYWVVAEDGVGLFDHLAVKLLDENDDELEVLALHQYVGPWFPRPPHSNGYVNFQHDLEGHTGVVKVAFQATRSDVFRLDHVVLTAQGFALPAPSITLFEADSTLYVYVDESDVKAATAGGAKIAFYVDGVDRYAAAHVTYVNRYAAAIKLNTYSIGSHFVHLVAEDSNQGMIDYAGPTWFTRRHVHELVANGGFESGLLHWDQISNTHYGLDFDAQTVGPYQGDHMLGLGWVGDPHETSVGQIVTIPFNIKGLEFSARISRSFESEGDQDPADTLYVDFVDGHGQVLVSQYLGIVPNTYLEHDPSSLIDTYKLVSFHPSTAALSGKTVTMRLRFVENEDGKSMYRIDNVSLTYTNWSLQLNN